MAPQMEALFTKGDLTASLRKHAQDVMRKIETLDPNMVLSRPPKDLAAEVLEEEALRPIQLHEEERSTSGASDVRLDVSGDPLRGGFLDDGPIYVAGTRIDLLVPFEGQAELFHLRPNRWTTMLPRASIESGRVRITWQAPADQVARAPEAVARFFEDELKRLREYIQWSSAQVDEFNTRLEDDVRQALARRRDKVLADHALEAALNIPVERRGDAPTFAVPVRTAKKRTVRFRQSPSAPPFEPGPAIGPEDYEAIVRRLASMARVVERTPQTFVEMPEESLRDTMLVTLNDEFGSATGETFRGRGKTDIHIEAGGGDVFLAECKWWKGAKAFREEAMPQLLDRYVVWRDTKAAIVLFIDRKDVTRVIAAAVGEVRAHPRYKRDGDPIAGVPTFILHKNGDPDREVRMALVTVPIPR